VPNELPFCLIVAGRYPKKYAYQYLLTSIFNQVYRNYHVVYVSNRIDYYEMKKLKKFIANNKKDKFVTIV